MKIKRILMVLMMMVVTLMVTFPLSSWGRTIVRIYAGEPFPDYYGQGTVFVDRVTGQFLGIQGQRGHGYSQYQNGSCQGYQGYGGYQDYQNQGCQGYGGYQDYQNQGCQGYGDNEKIFSRERWDTRGGERHFEKVPSIGGKIIDAVKTIGAFAIIYR